MYFLFFFLFSFLSPTRQQCVLAGVCLPLLCVCVCSAAAAAVCQQ